MNENGQRTTRLAPLYPVKLIKSGNAHYYQIGNDETFFPGATTVLKVLDKPAILPWALNCMGENLKSGLMSFTRPSNIPFVVAEEDIDKMIKESKNIYKKKSSEAADVGTRVHAAIDTIIRGEQPEITPDIKPAVDGFLEWQDRHKLRIEFGDTKLGSKIFGFGGSLDFVAFDSSGDAIIFDVKTTKKRRDAEHGAYNEAALQLSSYQQGFLETYGLRPKSLYVLWLNKEKPEFKPVKVTAPEKCFEGFLACLKLYQLSKWSLFEI